MDSKRTQPPYLQAHLKTAQATARPKFLKELAKPTKERISNFFSNALNKKLKHPTLKPPTKKKMKHTADKDYNYSTDRTPAGNSGFKKLAVQWLNQVQFFNQTLVQVDSLVLRNRQLLKPAKR